MSTRVKIMCVAMVGAISVLAWLSWPKMSIILPVDVTTSVAEQTQQTQNLAASSAKLRGPDAQTLAEAKAVADKYPMPPPESGGDERLVFLVYSSRFIVVFSLHQD